MKDYDGVFGARLIQTISMSPEYSDQYFKQLKDAIDRLTKSIDLNKKNALSYGYRGEAKRLILRSVRFLMNNEKEQVNRINYLNSQGTTFVQDYKTCINLFENNFIATIQYEAEYIMFKRAFSELEIEKL